MLLSYVGEESDGTETGRSNTVHDDLGPKPFFSEGNSDAIASYGGMDVASGSQIGLFRLLRELGEGGFGNPIRWPEYREAFGDRPLYEKLMREGMSKKSPDALVPLAKSWFHPAKIQEISGGTDAEYDRAQRAYVMTACSDKISFELAASSKSPVINPCLVIEHWNGQTDARVTLNCKVLPRGPGSRQGTTFDTDGNLMKIIWLQRETEEPTKMEVSKG